MTQQSALLLIPFLCGLVVVAVLLGTATRNILPRAAMAIAALAIQIWVVYFASSQGRSLLASEGFLNTQSDWIHPLLCVPRTSPWPLQFPWRAYSRGRVMRPIQEPCEHPQCD